MEIPLTEILHIYSKHDKIYIISTSGTVFHVLKMEMFLLPNVETMAGIPENMGPVITPHLDLYKYLSPSQILTNDGTKLVADLGDWSGFGETCVVTAGVDLNRSVGDLASGHITDGNVVNE